VPNRLCRGKSTGAPVGENSSCVLIGQFAGVRKA
jgi:hypothetical protein